MASNLIEHTDLENSEMGGPVLDRVPGGYRGSRVWSCTATNEEDAASFIGAGVPEVGDAWGTLAAYCSQVQVRRHSGSTYRLIASYEPPSQSILPNEDVQDSKSYHEFRNSTGQTTVEYDTSLVALPEPATAEVGTAELIVEAYKSPANYVTARASWAALVGKVNSDTVPIPPMRQCPGSGFNCVQGQLIMRTMEAEPVGDSLVRIRYTLGFAPPPSGGGPSVWDVIQTVRDENGVPLSSVVSEVQERAAFNPAANGLW